MFVPFVAGTNFQQIKRAFLIYFIPADKLRVDGVKMSSSHDQSTTSTDVTEHGVFQVSVDEIAHSHLINAFKVIGPALGICIQSKLSQAYGEEKWRQKAGYGLSKGMYSRLEDTRRHPLKDIFLICELILFNVEVFSADMVNIHGIREKAVWLERLVADVDFVSRTRTLLFHGVCVCQRVKSSGV